MIYELRSFLLTFVSMNFPDFESMESFSSWESRLPTFSGARENQQEVV
jgi:hypothetical protein